MDSSLRNTPGLIGRIEKHRDDLIKHYDRLVSHAAIDRTDRNTTSVTQYQMQTETASIIRAAEDLQVLIRQLQEMWLFGKLDTLGDGKLRASTDEGARAVAEQLERLAELHSGEKEGMGKDDGHAVGNGGEA